MNSTRVQMLLNQYEEGMIHATAFLLAIRDAMYNDEGVDERTVSMYYDLQSSLRDSRF